MVKASACNVVDPDSIPGSGRSPEKEMATHSSILAWEVAWTEELGGYSPGGRKRVEQDLLTNQQQHGLGFMLNLKLRRRISL